MAAEDVDDNGKGAFLFDLDEEATERQRRYIGAVNGKSVKVFTIGGSTALFRSEEVADHIRTYNNEERCTAFGKGVVLGRKQSDERHAISSEAADLRQRRYEKAVGKLSSEKKAALGLVTALERNLEAAEAATKDAHEKLLKHDRDADANAVRLLQATNEIERLTSLLNAAAPILPVGRAGGSSKKSEGANAGASNKTSGGTKSAGHSSKNRAERGRNTRRDRTRSRSPTRNAAGKKRSHSRSRSKPRNVRRDRSRDRSERRRSHSPVPRRDTADLQASAPNWDVTGEKKLKSQVALTTDSQPQPQPQDRLKGLRQQGVDCGRAGLGFVGLQHHITSGFCGYFTTTDRD